MNLNHNFKIGDYYVVADDPDRYMYQVSQHCLDTLDFCSGEFRHATASEVDHALKTQIMPWWNNEPRA